MQVVVAQANKDHIGNIGLVVTVVCIHKYACIVRTDMRSAAALVDRQDDTRGRGLHSLFV